MLANSRLSFHTLRFFSAAKQNRRLPTLAPLAKSLRQRERQGMEHRVVYLARIIYPPPLGGHRPVTQHACVPCETDVAGWLPGGTSDYGPPRSFTHRLLSSASRRPAGQARQLNWSGALPASKAHDEHFEGHVHAVSTGDGVRGGLAADTNDCDCYNSQHLSRVMHRGPWQPSWHNSRVPAIQ